MAEFNPDVGNAPAPDFTGVSRGTGPNRAFEALFSGVGNALEQGVRTADTYIQNKIEDDARYGFESQNQEFGLDSDVVPSEITQTSEGLSALALAHQQGKVTPEYYYQRLTATMKGLRAKYPGYEKEVDNIIQNVTGTRPANAFRDALFQNIASAQQAAASSQTKTQTFVQNNSKYLNEDEILNPQKYGGLEGLATTINLRKSREYQWEAEEKQVERDQKLALPTLNQRFNFTAADSLSQLSKAVGFGDQSFDAGLRNLGSTGFTPEQQANAIAGIDAVIAQTEAKMLQDQNRPAFSTLPPTQLRDMRVAALQPLRDIREKIAGKDYSGAAILAASLQLSQDQAKAQLYKTDPRFTTLDALKGIAPDVANTMTNEIIQESGSSRAFFDKVSTYNLVGGVVQGADTSNSVIDRLENNPNLNQAQKNSEAGAYVDGLTRTLGKAEIPSEQLSQIILKNYAEDSGADRLWSAVTSDQKLALYQKLFSPEITKKVFENGSDEAKAAYQNAAVNRFQNIPEFREAAANLSEQLPYAQFAQASYDPRTNRLRIDVDRSAMANLGYFQRDNQQAEIQRLGQFADRFNQALTVMAPIIEGAGGDETEGIKRLLSDMNVEVNGGKKSGVYYWLSTVVDDLLKPSPTEGVDVNQSRENMGLEEITSPEVQEADDELTWSFPDNSQEVSGDALAFAGSPSSGQAVGEVVRAGPGWTQVRLANGEVVHRQGARNWRNNNPGNIEAGSFARRYGAVGSDGRFAVFPTYEAGRRAKAALIFESPRYRDLSISEAINRYAPPFENNTTAYANGVARAAGVSLDTKMSSLSQSQRERVLNAMERIEGFRQGTERVVRN